VSAQDTEGTLALEALAPRGYKGKALFGEALAPHTSYGVGGCADALFEPADTEDLTELLRALHASCVPVTVIGAGTNLLVSDSGVRGAVVRIGDAFSHIRIDGMHVASGAGAKLRALSQSCADASLAGLEFACGIPGSVGGAVAMNAGAWGHEIKDVLRSASVATRDGRIEELPVGELEMAYRRSSLRGSGHIVVEAVFSLKKGDPTRIRRTMAEYDAKRQARQPSGRTAGCVFKNPPGDYASELLDRAGAKGLSVGSARVSEMHANFVVNTGGARASDIRELIRKMQSLVEEAFGIRLEPEIEFIGEW
jgi:UDP-N-acetylmuramate dehydrogenase